MSGEVLPMEKPITLREVHELMEAIFEAVAPIAARLDAIEKRLVEEQDEPKTRNRGRNKATLEREQRIATILQNGKPWHYIQVAEELERIGDKLNALTVGGIMLDMFERGELERVQKGMYRRKLNGS